MLARSAKRLALCASLHFLGLSGMVSAQIWPAVSRFVIPAKSRFAGLVRNDGFGERRFLDAGNK